MTTERVTKGGLDAIAATLNRRLEAHGSHARVVVERRYGYVGIDETNEAGQVQRTLTTGLTMRQAYDALWHMVRALDLLPDTAARVAELEAGIHAYLDGQGYSDDLAALVAS